MGKPQATIDRAIALRTRADLVASAVEGVGATTWIVKDPLTLEHFQFSAEEYGLVEWLREPVSIAELQRLFQRRFAPQTITATAIWEFLSRLHAAGLLISDATGQGHELLERRKRRRFARQHIRGRDCWGFGFGALIRTDSCRPCRRDVAGCFRR